MLTNCKEADDAHPNTNSSSSWESTDLYSVSEAIVKLVFYHPGGTFVFVLFSSRSGLNSCIFYQISQNYLSEHSLNGKEATS